MAGLTFDAAAEKVNPGIEFFTYPVSRLTLSRLDLNAHRVVTVLVKSGCSFHVWRE